MLAPASTSDATRAIRRASRSRTSARRARLSACSARSREVAASLPTTSAATRKTPSATTSSECEIRSWCRGSTKKKLSASTLPTAVPIAGP